MIQSHTTHNFTPVNKRERHPKYLPVHATKRGVIIAPSPYRATPRNPARNNYAHVKRTAPYHITWHRIVTYTATYKAGKRGKGKQTLVIHSIDPPPPYREFQTAGTTLKLFKRTSITRTKRRIIIMASTKTKSGKARSKKATDEDLEAIEGLEELEEAVEDEDEEDEDVEETETDDESDEDEDDDDEDEDDDEDVETPSSKKSKKKKSKAPKQSRAAKEGKIGTSEIAAKAGVDARTLRIVLRKHKIAKDEESGRYEWDSFDDKTVKKIMKLLSEGAADQAKKESFDKLKEKGEAKKGKKGKKGKKSKPAPEPDVEDDDEDEDDE